MTCAGLNALLNVTVAGYGKIVISYQFPSGVQGSEHPNPGQRYQGTSRTAYLPDNHEGREVLQFLRRAFDARLVVYSGYLKYNRAFKSGHSGVLMGKELIGSPSAIQGTL